MRNNLQLYHSVLNQICQWLPEERATRQRNMALVIQKVCSKFWMKSMTSIPKSLCLVMDRSGRHIA